MRRQARRLRPPARRRGSETPPVGLRQQAMITQYILFPDIMLRYSDRHRCRPRATTLFPCSTIPKRRSSQYQSFRDDDPRHGITGWSVPSRVPLRPCAYPRLRIFVPSRLGGGALTAVARASTISVPTLWLLWVLRQVSALQQCLRQMTRQPLRRRSTKICQSCRYLISAPRMSAICR